MGYGSNLSLKFFLYDVVCCRDSVGGVARIDRVRIFLSVTVIQFIQTGSRGSFNLWITRHYKYKLVVVI